MHMVTETYQLRDGEKLTEFYNGIDWESLFEFVRHYYSIGVENEAPSTIWCHPQNSCLLSLRGITGDDQIAQWDTRFDAKGKKVLDDAE